ncbi:MAG: histidine phosphatase family protein [Polyangiales bacterium]
MGPRRRIYLLRHGDAAYMGSGDGDASDDPLLSDRGVEEAKALGRYFEGVPIDLAISSGLRRTRQTAELALGDRDLPIEVIAGLSEAKSGNFEDIQTAEEMEALVLGAFQDAEEPGAQFLTGETFAAVRERATAALQALIERADWRCALIACHGVVNRTLLAHALGAGPEAYRRFEQDSGCVNVLDVDGHGPDARIAYVRMINFTPHNPTKSGMVNTSLEVLWRRFMGD